MENNTSSCCGHDPQGITTHQGTAQDVSLTARSELGQDEMTVCSVMAGTPVVKAQAEAAGLYRDHEGQRYWFCCAGCGPAFDADPATYALAAG